MPGLVKVPEEPQLPRHAVPRQHPRRDAIQERTQECMTSGIGVVEVQKPMVFAISKVPARLSAGIGVVEVQKPMVFCDF